MTVQKLNESYSVISDTPDNLKRMYDFLKVERPGAFFEPLVKAGMKSKYDYFGSIQNKKLLVMNGHLSLLKMFNISTDDFIPEYTEKELDNFLNNIELPFEPYDYQIKAFKESILNGKQLNKCCTASGKSLIIALIAEFFRQQGKKGVLLVPNISLLTQMRSDFIDYQLNDLVQDLYIIGGGSTDKHFNKSITISTWQSLQNYHNNLNELDYVMVDECLHPDTSIQTINGKEPIKNIKPGDFVLTLNEETQELEYKPVIKIHKNLGSSRNEKMLELITENGDIINITANHKIKTSTGWKRADELTLNDEIIHLNYK